MKSKHLYILIGILIWVALSRCANQGAPMGGPKDSLSPVLLKTIPTNKSLQFKGNKIELVFDEYVKIENLKKQLIITPRLKGEYEYNVIKNRIELELLEPLEENTTYTFNFRDAIKDITEGNKTSNLVLVFSTGTYLDSLEIKGKVYQLLDGKKSADCVVALYEASDSTNLFTDAPKYFSKTDTSGSYHLQNLKDGWYKVYAYQDKNENTICEPQYESYGFKADSFLLSQNTSPTLLIYNSDIREPKLLSTGTYGKYFEIRYNKFVKDYKIEYKDLIYSNLEEKNRNIKVYNPGIGKDDSLQLIVSISDTLDIKLIDTTYAKFKESKLEPTKLNITYTIKQTDQIDESINFKISFNKPILSTNTDSIYLLYDSARIEKLNIGTDLLWNTNKTELVVNKLVDKTKIGIIESQASNQVLNSDEKIEQTKNSDSKSISQAREKPTNQNTVRPGAQSDNKLYTSPFYLHFNKGAFISIENDTSEASVKTLTIINPRNVATIAGKILGEETKFVIQLLDKTYKVVAEIKDMKEYLFKNVAPGEYYIRVMVDDNKNGQWDLGNINDGKEPEKVVFYKGKLSLRANFEVRDINIQL